jgi:hypothetical protein
MPDAIPTQAKTSHEVAFEISEASVRLEGIDPMQFPIYRELKARILAGEITSDQATDILLAQYTAANQTAA